MKYSYIAIAALLVAACTPEPEQQPEQQPSDLKVTLPGIEGVETRVALSTDGNGGIACSWQDGDVLMVGGKTFTIKSINGRTASFDGDWTAGSRADIVYGKAGDTPAQQTQTGNDNVAHLKYWAELKGVELEEEVTFSHDWATAHGGTLRQSGVLRLELALPEKVSAVKSVTVSGDGIPETTLTVTGGSTAGGSFVAYIQTGSDIVFKTGDNLTLTVIDGADEEYVNSFEPGPQTVYGCYVTTVRTTQSRWLHSLSGKGSESDPYAITNLEELDNIRNILTENTITYFRLMSDIDMSSVKDWKPFNQQNAGFGIFFDGNGKTISNFTCTDAKWASFFGVLHGTVKNLTFVNPVIRTTTDSEVGVVCAWAGNSGGTLSGHLENVRVTGGTVSCSGTSHYFGGLCGRACNSSIENCSFEGSVERTSTVTYSTTYVPVGGILGQATNDVTISGCETSGKLITKGGRSCGGIVGYCSVALDITSCRSSMDIDATHDVAGGICGYFGTGTVSDCSYSGTIKVGVGGGSSYVGGLVAHTAGDITIVRGSFTGAIQAAEGIVGGILGQCNTSQTGGAVLEQCRSTGPVTGKTVVGGIIGRASNSGLKMSDCYATGDVSATGSYVGGAVGDFPMNTVCTNCFAAGAVKGSFALGGFAGRAFGRQGSSASPKTDVNTTVTGCIAWNPSVTTVTAAGETPSNHYSGATIIGFSSLYNTLSNNWRNPAMTFKFYADDKLNVPFDQEASGPGNPLVFNYTDASTLKWYYPYHGKAAASGETLSAVASRIGYDTAVWDLSGNVPELKCFK